MKTFFIFLSLFVVSAAFASSEDLYKALNVPQVDERPLVDGHPQLGQSVFSKSAGGLRCVETSVVSPDAVPHYVCSVNSDGFDGEVIYGALNVAEKKDNASSPDGKTSVATSKKSVDGLACEKNTITRSGEAPKTKYLCILNF